MGLSGAYYQFTEFFLDTILDQIQFMTELLELNKMLQHITIFSQNQIELKQLPKYSDKLLSEVYIRGEVTRGAMSEIIGQPESSTKRVISELLKQRLLISDTPKGALRLSFPLMALGYYFPNYTLTVLILITPLRFPPSNRILKT